MIKLLIFVLLISAINGRKYTPDWPSLDSRPLPDWYDKAKIGIFMHSGVYSVPGVGSEWFWENWKTRPNASSEGHYMKSFFPPTFSYQDFGPELKFEFFDANEFAKIVKDSGAKYLVFTSKHHDGFCNFQTKHSFGWNSVDIGPKRDILMELKQAFEQTDGRFGLYHSLFEWFNPLYLNDKSNNYTTKQYVETKMTPEFKDMVTKYKPEIIWSDGDWEAYPEYWDSQGLLAWLFNESPTKDTIVTNDRWGIGTKLKHGSFYSGNDKFNPGVLQKHKWEDATTVDQLSWGYRRNIKIQDVITPFQLISTIAEVVSTGGNLLINVGPTKEGTICPIFQERLRQMGAWLNASGEAIYETVPWKYQNETTNEGIKIWYTSNPNLNKVYAIMLGWPKNSPIIDLTLPITNDKTEITMPCADYPLDFAQQGRRLKVELPDYSTVKSKCGEVGDWAYVVTFKNLTPESSISRPHINIIN